MKRSFPIYFRAILLFFFVGSFAKVEKGNIRGSSITDDWIFVSKFCFDTGLGNLSWTGFSSDTSKLQLLFYDDVSDSWPTVYSQRNSLSCEQKVSMAKGNRSIVSGEHHLQSFNDISRPHFWFLAISNCGASSRLEFQYEFEFLNSGGAWKRQFSYDEQGLVGMHLFFWLFFTMVFIVHLRGVWILFQSNAFHPIVRLLTVTLLLETVSLFCLFVHYAIYASNGVGANGLHGLGELLDMCAQLVFMLLLILIAKGWAITRTLITGQKLVLIMVSSFTIGYISLFTWQNVGMDHASTLYIYESVPGIILLVLRVFTLGWFLWELRTTYLQETDSNKRRFYLMFGGAYTVWFLMLVIIVLIALIIPAWDRAKVVIGMSLCNNCLGFCLLAFLLWPSRAMKYFQIVQKEDLLLGATYNNSPYESL